MKNKGMQVLLTFIILCTLLALLVSCTDNTVDEYDLSVSCDATQGTVESTKLGTTEAGTTIEVNAIPNDNYKFIGWYINDAIASENSKYTFKMPEHDLVLTAKFVLKEVLVNLVSNDLSEGSVALSSTNLTPGAEAIATATPTPFYSFVGWYEGTSLVSSEIAYTFLVPSTPITLFAKFIRDRYTLSIKMIMPDNTTETYDYGIFKGGSLVSVVPRENDYYGFSEWRTLEDAQLGSISDLEYTMPNGNATIVSKYIGVSTTLNVVASDPARGEAKNTTTTFLSGDLVSLLAEAHSGYGFTGWYVLGKKVSDNYSFNYKATKRESTITAQFDLLYNFVATIKSGAGEITGSKNGGYLPGSIINISVTTTDSYDFDGWYNSDTLMGRSVECSYTMSAEDVTIEAKVATKYDYIANTFNADMGTINGANTGKFSAVRPVTITTNPKEGYEFDGWYKDRELLSLEDSYTLSDETTAQEITARFILSDMTCILYNDMYLIETYAGTLTSIIIPDMYKGHVLQGFYGEPHWTDITALVDWTAIAMNLNGTNANKLFQNRTLDKVTFLSTEMFEYNDASPFYHASINEIIIPEGVVQIPSFMFCSIITESIVLPVGLKNIGVGAFFDSRIPNIELPTGLEYIDTYAFTVSRVESIEIPGSVRVIGYHAFHWCAHLASITIQDGVMEIHTSAFAGSRITSLYVPSSVTNMGEQVFFGCSELEYVEFHANVKANIIPNDTFGACYSLRSIVLGANIEGCGYLVFEIVQDPQIPIVLKIFTCSEDSQFLFGLKYQINTATANVNGLTVEYYLYSATRKNGAWCYVEGIATPWSEIE
ncbi:MAG: leucine-rich repeat protein [Christensenellaceae bacterium]|jgi:hypothetical protein|nr:leucine-rich repeat protein [Christensenellaceae bacterium]